MLASFRQFLFESRCRLNMKTLRYCYWKSVYQAAIKFQAIHCIQSKKRTETGGRCDFFCCFWGIFKTLVSLVLSHSLWVLYNQGRISFDGPLAWSIDEYESSNILKTLLTLKIQKQNQHIVRRHHACLETYSK